VGKKAFSILAKKIALLVLAFAQVKINLAIFANIESLLETLQNLFACSKLDVCSFALLVE
jgi:hypothetical protein